MALEVQSAGILFPGQGAQSVGMGRWLCDSYPSARARFEEASDVLGYDLTALCHEGPEVRLQETEYSQPALFVVGIAAAEALAETAPQRLAPVRAAAGLSLGEYTAVCFAGGLDFADGVRLVRRRGEAMQAAADAVPSGMASVLGLELSVVEELCESTRQDGEVLRPANLLCPGNIAVSGHMTAIERLQPAAIAAGAMKVIRLNVAGAFHTPLMEAAVERLREALEEIPIRDTELPVYSNVDARPHRASGEIRELLGRQVVEPVRWEDAVRQMVADGVEGFLEVGTGRVLRGTIKRIGRKLPTDGFGDGEESAR